MSSAFLDTATTAGIAANGCLLTPGRYGGAGDVEPAREDFEERMQALTVQLQEQFAESARLEKEIAANMKGLGYGS